MVEFCMLVYQHEEKYVFATYLLCICTVETWALFLPAFHLKESVVVAVNQEYIGKEQVVPLKKVAIIPPISGG